MVQFKDVFLGTDKRPYTRAVNSQKCMRVAGKHNDLDDVGRDDTHHTFFEMLGNWSFGRLLQKRSHHLGLATANRSWGLDQIKTVDYLFSRMIKEIFRLMKKQLNLAASSRELIRDHILYFGRKENFWEMAEIGPCGPCSEIHMDLGPEVLRESKHVPGHVCRVNGDCKRFLELWNLVFIQYNRIECQISLDPLPPPMWIPAWGWSVIVSVMQKVYSNYRTDLLLPLIDTVQEC